MLPFFWYMLKVIICSGILFGYYWLFLRNKIFHGYNRFYLLASMLLSLALPLLKINFWQPASQQSQAIRVLRAVSVGDDYINNIIVPAQRNNWSIEQLYSIAYWLVCIIFFLVMLRTLFLIRTLLKKYPVQQLEDVAFVNTEDDSTPFSFLKYIFWNSNIDIATTTGRQIFKHEVAHIQEKHTHDKLFVNITLIFCWCNPFFWLYRKELNMIHEFIADKKAVEDSDTAAFAAMILQAAYPKHRFELVNNFFYSPIKRRLLMLSKNKNPKVNYIGRIMVLPLLVLVFAAFTFKAKTSTSFYHGKKITVVIDAGHGGKDLGATTSDGIFEKDLALAIAKKVKELNSNDAIEIVLTRNEDMDMNAQQRVDFSKSKNADLFISFHIDKVPNDVANKRSGMSVWVAKDEFSNAAKSKELATTILNEFSSNYGLPVLSPLNQRQQGVYVLQGNSCPAVLIEAGFITNKADLAYLQTSAARENIAKNILVAIEKFAGTSTMTTSTQQKTIVDLPTNAVSKDTMPERIITGINPKAAAPLYIVNGHETDKAIALNIKPEEIELVRVIKEDVAIRVYGEKGKNGVVIINMKPGFGIPKNNFTAGTLRVSDSATGKNFDATNALIILDGIEYEYKKLREVIPPGGFGGDKSIVILNSKEAVKLYGEKGKDGAIVITTEQTKTDDSYQKSNNLKAPNEEAKIYIGNIAGGRIDLAYLKAQKEIAVTNGYSFVSATLYFSGNSFDKVVQANLNSSSLSSVENYISQCKNGSVLIFDNLYLKDNNGKIFEAQNHPGFTVVAETDDKVFTQVEQSPQYTGGPEAWRKFLQANLQVNTPVDHGAKAGIYKVVLKFIVNADGSLSDITCEKDPGFGTGTEAIRLIKTTPKWQPAMQNGKRVSAYLKQPITFVVEE